MQKVNLKKKKEKEKIEPVSLTVRFQWYFVMMFQDFFNVNCVRRDLQTHPLI